MNDKISVIVPIYKVEDYLDRCIESLVGQTYSNLEIILVDDGSPDSCPTKCDEWAKRDPRIKVIHKENGGVSNSRNVGMKSATGDYIAFVDGDDFIHKEMYEKLLASIQQNGSDMSFCGYYVYEEEKQKHREVIGRRLECHSSDTVRIDFERIVNKKENYHIIDNLIGAVWRYLYRREVVQNVFFLEEIFIAEDVIFLLDIFKKGVNVSLVLEPLYYYVQRDNSAMHLMTKRRMDNRILSSQAIFDRLEDIFSFDIVDAKKFNMYHNLICEQLFAGHKKEIKELVKTDFMKNLRTKNNYKSAMKYAPNIKYKVAYFLVYHHLISLYNFLLKLKK